MPSLVSIYNKALIALGRTPLLSPNDDNEEARACNAIYEQVRDGLLESHLWNFATKRATLQRDPAYAATEYAYRHPLPSDFIRLHKEDSLSIEDDWAIEGRSLLCNVTPALITYICKLTDTSQYSPSFANAVSYGMAAAISLRLTGSLEIASRMQSMAVEALNDARYYDALQRERDIHQPVRRLTDRMTGVSDSPDTKPFPIFTDDGNIDGGDWT